jgi:hypothetical protein
MYETIAAFYGTIDGVITSRNVKEWASDNGKKPHSLNGEKVPYSGNGKKEDIKVNQSLNG